MSRVGKQPVHLPEKVKAVVSGNLLQVEGPKGKLSLTLDQEIGVAVNGQELVCQMKSESPEVKARYGLVRSLVANMVEGCAKGFEEQLEVIGVGYRAAVKGKTLELSLGFSHPVVYPIPEGITIAVDKQTFLKVSGADKQLVGQTAAEIRHFRLPEPYKGKGIKYAGETIRRKAGKAAGGGTTAAA